MSREDAVLAMHVAEQYSLPAQHEFQLPDIRAHIASLALPGDMRTELTYADIVPLQKRNLIAAAGERKFTLTDCGRELGEQLLKHHPRRHKAMSDGRFRMRLMPSLLERSLRLSELLALDAAQGRRSHWVGHGFSTTDVDAINPDPAAQRQEAAVLFRVSPLWESVQRRWKRAWTVLSLAVVTAEAIGVVLALRGFGRWWELLVLATYVRTTSPFRGFRYMARLVHLINPRSPRPPIHEPGYQPSAAFALYLREFQVERNQQLNALNARWGMDPYERRIGRILERRRLSLLGLVDPFRPEPPQFLQNAVSVADDRWAAEVRRLVPAAAIIILDLRKHSLSADFDITRSVETELTIIQNEGDDERTIGLGSRGAVFVPGGMIWHLQPQSLTALDIAFGFFLGVVTYLLSVDEASWAIGYMAGRLHVASGTFLLAWRHRFRSLLDRILTATR